MGSTQDSGSKGLGLSLGQGTVLCSWARHFTLKVPLSRGGGGGTPIYGLYRYVPRDRVWFLRFSVLK